MADLAQLKQKYAPVLHTLEIEGAQVTDLSLAGEQLALSANVVSEASKNRVWDSIKSVDPTFADLKHNIQVVPGQQVYTVQPGDNLSKISKYFYGNANKYMDIAKANGLADPDKIKAGQHPAWVEDVRPRNKAVRIAVRDQTCCVVPKWHYRYIFE